MSKILSFSATLNAIENNQALNIDFPYSVEEIYGVKGLVKVKVTFDGIPYRGSLAKMGHHCHFLLVRKDIKAQLGKQAGDSVLVTVEQDLEERIVDIPEDLGELFETNSAAFEHYETLSYTNRKEYVRWIEDAKRSETRANRLQKTIEMLLNKKKNPSDK